MATIDVSGLTLNPKEKQAFSEFVFQLIATKPELKSVHNLVQGITMKEQIVLISQLGKTGIKADTSCDRNMSGAGVVLSEKYWEPKGIEDTLEICQKTVDQLFKAYYDKITSYKQNYDVTGSDEELMLIAMLENSIINTLHRAIWFGDTAVAAADGTTAGLKSADDVKFYDYFNGLWKQIFTGVTAGDILKVAISENSETTLADQLTLSAGRSVALFNEVYKKAPSILRTQPDAQYLVTFDLFQNYREYLQGKGENFTIDYTVNGLETLMFQGKKIVNMETVWGQGTTGDFVDNTTNNAGYLPNRIVFTTPANIPVGTLNEADFADIESFYVQKDRKSYIGYGLQLDAKVIEEELIVVAY